MYIRLQRQVDAINCFRIFRTTSVIATDEETDNPVFQEDVMSRRNNNTCALMVRQQLQVRDEISKLPRSLAP
jgi:hypothetical protein